MPVPAGRGVVPDAEPGMFPRAAATHSRMWLWAGTSPAEGDPSDLSVAGIRSDPEGLPHVAVPGLPRARPCQRYHAADPPHATIACRDQAPRGMRAQRHIASARVARGIGAGRHV